MDSKTKFLAVGLNPAWQKTVHFQRLCVGDVNRADWLRESGGGKAVNFARAARQLAGNVTVAQLAGGYSADLLCHELDQAGITHLTVRTASRTRGCTTIIDATTSLVTELIEPSGEVSLAEVAEVRRRILAEIDRFEGVALCGTVPPGVPPSFYAEIATAARPHGIVLLDAVRDVDAVLHAGVDILKINIHELQALSGEVDVVSAARCCFQNYPVAFLAITAGSDLAYLFHREHAWKFTLPRLAKVSNTIGAGDCASAVILLRATAKRRKKQVVANLGTAPAMPRDILAPDDMTAVFADALAHASASCLTALPAEFSSQKASELRKNIVIERLSLSFWTR